MVRYVLRQEGLTYSILPLVDVNSELRALPTKLCMLL